VWSSATSICGAFEERGADERGLDMIRIKRPIFVMMFAAVMIFGAALLLSTMIDSSERPIETNVSTLSSKAQ
jgi:hypothetical protein